MKNSPLKLESERLTLIPFTLQICEEIRNNQFVELEKLDLKKGINWPDQALLETLPKIIRNLSLFPEPTGFESWMIIKTDTHEIIGDIGFKGYHMVTNSADIGYGLIEAEQGKGYAIEAAHLLVDWAFSNEELTMLTAACLIDNISSYKLLEKLNFEIVDQDQNYYFWELPRQNVKK